MIIVAYVDPGLGLLAWQALVAFFVGLLFYVKKTRTWLIRLVQRPLIGSKQPSPPPSKLQPPSHNPRQ